MTLGEAIRVKREERGMSLRELARRVGISAPFLSDIELGRRHTVRLGAIAEALQAPPLSFETMDKEERMVRDLQGLRLSPLEKAAVIEAAKKALKRLR